MSGKSAAKQCPRKVGGVCHWQSALRKLGAATLRFARAVPGAVAKKVSDDEGGGKHLALNSAAFGRIQEWPLGDCAKTEAGSELVQGTA